MSYKDRIRSRNPLVWVNTFESYRLISELTKEGVQILRQDLRYGIVSWDTEKSKWVRLLRETGAYTSSMYPVMSCVSNLRSALAYIRTNPNSVLIVDQADSYVRQIVPDLLNIVGQWVDSVREDNLNNVPGTVFLAATDFNELPPAIKRLCANIDYDLPTSDEIQSALEFVQEAAHVETDSMQNLVRAARGMSEVEVFSTACKAIAEDGKLDAGKFNAEKLALLKRDHAIEIRIPTMGLENIGGLDLAKDLIESIAWVWANPLEAKRFHVEPIRRVMMVGVPGTGKSAICEAVAGRLNLDLASIGVSKAMSKFVGESESNMRNTFKAVKALAPIVMWIDEFGRDMSGSESSGSVDGGTTDRVHGEFLTGLQELPSDIFLIAAANRIDSLPPEMLRADRFDKFLFVGLPSMEERMEIFKIHLGPEDASQHRIEALAQITSTFTGAEIKALIRETRFAIATHEQRAATDKDIAIQAKKMRGRIWDKPSFRTQIAAMYERALEEWDWASSQQYEAAGLILDMARGKTVNSSSKIASMV